MMSDEIADTRNYTILVDQSAMNEDWTQEFVRARGKDPLCRLILLVEYPDGLDYNQYQWPNIDFDVIVRNSGLKRTAEFKLHALNVIRDASDYNVVIAIETTRVMREIFYSEAIPLVFDEKGSLFPTYG